MGDRQRILHLVTPYLFHTGSWVYTQLTGTSRFEYRVFTSRKRNLDQFPFSGVFGPDDLDLLRRTVSTAAWRVFDRSGVFFGPMAESFAPHLYHAHMGYEAARWLPFVSRRQGTLVTSFYGADVSSLARIPKWRRKYERLFEYGACFLAEGTNMKAQLVALGCPADKVIVQHLGIPVEKYPVTTAASGERKGPVLLQVATFREKKGLPDAMKAVARILPRHPELEFRIVGGGDTPDVDRDMERLARSLGIGANVRFLGVRTHAETLVEMARADIFLHPSCTAADGDNEGGAPVGLIEASAVGLPVVSTLHADIPEVVIDGVSGLLAREHDVDAIASSLEQLISHPELRGRMGKAGREHVSRHYHLATQIARMERLYESLIH